MASMKGLGRWRTVSSAGMIKSSRGLTNKLWVGWLTQVSEITAINHHATKKTNRGFRKSSPVHLIVVGNRNNPANNIASPMFAGQPGSGNRTKEIIAAN